MGQEVGGSTVSCEAHALAKSRGMLKEEDVDLIRELVDVAMERLGVGPTVLNVCDLGAESGTKALAVFAAARHNVRVTTIDWDADALGWAGLAVSNIGRKDDWRGVNTESGSVTIGSVDLLLVDIEHNYDGTKGILETWLPKMKDSGIVWVHDYEDGVKRAIDDLVDDGQLVKLATRGLGWTGAKPQTGGVVESAFRTPVPKPFALNTSCCNHPEKDTCDEECHPGQECDEWCCPKEPSEEEVTPSKLEPEPETSHDCECGWDVPEGKDPVKSLRTHRRVAKVHSS